VLSVDNGVARCSRTSRLTNARVEAAGLPCAELAVELARAVLGHPEVQLAQNVLEGGSFAHARATELANRVLDAGDTERRAGRLGMAAVPDTVRRPR